MSFRRILIAIDSDAVSTHACDVGSELADELRAYLALVHVVNDPGGSGAETEASQGERRAQRKEAGRRLVGDFRKRLSPKTAALEFVEAGNPAEEIAKAARNWPADLIVIGSHSRTDIQHALVGSVAEAVMRLAPCPVLVVRALA